MRRSLFLIAVLFVALSWTKPAAAQFFNNNTQDPETEIESARTKQKQAVQKYSRPSAARARAAAGTGLDRYGRLDLSGRPAPGYPTVRGDITGLGAARVSRGGANGVARRRGRR